MMTKRRKISGYSSRKLFRKTANRTNVANLPGNHQMMRGGKHF